MTLGGRYRRFALLEARGRSPLYERLALGVADDPAIHAVLARVPPPRQQPNLLLAAVAFLGGVRPDYVDFRSFVLDHADAVIATLGRYPPSILAADLARCIARTMPSSMLSNYIAGRRGCPRGVPNTVPCAPPLLSGRRNGIRSF